jgi:hypothetical protein
MTMPLERPHVSEHRALLIAAGGAVAFMFAIASGAMATDDRAARRLAISQMPIAEQQELLRKQEQFLALPTDEQNRLRTLQAAIDADPKSEQLNRVLKQYHEWLKTLSPGERAELAELSPADRVAKIKQFQQRQRTAKLQVQRTEALTPQDMRVVLRWTQDLLWEHREKLFKDMPESWRKKLEREDVRGQRRALLYAATFPGRKSSGPHPLSMVKQSDVSALADKLSPTAKEELAKTTDLSEQRKIVRGWIGASMHELEPSWQRPRKLPLVVEQELTQFFERDLRPSQRERLLNLPNEQMREELRRMYFQRERLESGGPEDRGPPPPGPPRDHDKGAPRPRGPRLPRDGGLPPARDPESR